MPRCKPTVAFVSLLLASCLPRAFSAEFLVRTAAEITQAQQNARPGDTLIMADGVWNNQNIAFSKTGTAAAPITLRAQTPGRVILTGTSKLTISGSHLLVDGLTFKDGSLTSGNIISFTSSSSFSRLTNSAIIDYDAAGTSGYHWIRLDGQQNRIDHNFVKGHKNSGVTLEIFPQVGSKHLVDNNHFVDRPAGSGNGFETIRIGLSGIQTRSAQATVQGNLFERTDGELEIISNKTSNNIIRNNTFRASNGTLTLRHGQGSLVEGNFFLGENKPGSGGVRVIGPNHVVVNNYFSDLDTNAISLTTGYSDWSLPGTATGYEPVNNVLIAHNTAVNITDQIITRDAGYSSSSTRNVRPANVTVANNILLSTHERLIQGTEGPNWIWAGNIAFGTTVGKSGAGILNVNPQLVKDAAGIWRPAPGSPAINSAAVAGPWPPQTLDMDGQTRNAPLDIGADEVAGVGPRTSGPLSGSDVGPSWLKRRTLALENYGVPVYLIEAEHFTARRDPNNDGDTWAIIPSPSASGGAFLKAPSGSRTDVPAQTHDAIVEYDLAFHDPGAYFLYALTRGLDSGSNSLYAPLTLGAEPTVNKSIPDDGQWAWVELASYNILAADVNRPLTLKLGRRERDLELDMLILSPTRLTLTVPEPAALALLPACLLSLRPRRLRNGPAEQAPRPVPRAAKTIKKDPPFGGSIQ